MLIHPALESLKKVERINIRFPILLDLVKGHVDIDLNVVVIIFGQVTGDVEHALVCVCFTNRILDFFLITVAN